MSRSKTSAVSHAGHIVRFFYLTLILCVAASFVVAQPPDDTGKPKVRTVSIPISIFTKQELKEDKLQELVQLDRLIVRENKEEQTLLSIRSVTETPLALAVIIQDDLTSNVNLQLRDIAKFIRTLPKGSRVMVAYARGGSPEIRQRFTDDLEKAAAAIRPVLSSGAVAPRSPYDSIVDILNRFDALPAGRRAILLISDGLDSSSGFGHTTPGDSIDLDKAILRAQRKSVAVFTIYSPSAATEDGSSPLVLNGQSSLLKLTEETGGRAFFQGMSAPVSFDPFFRDLSMLLNRQFLLTYLSTHMKRGYYRVEVVSTNPDVKIEHPKGYYYR